MNKVITVNLNGRAYQLEESGYIALHEYLQDAEAKLKNNPDLREIMADLEQAIADKCDKQLSPNKNVITKSEVEQILSEMGRVEADESDTAGDTSQPKGNEGSRTDPGAPKRLYRILEGSMIAGVCKGIAVYVNVDVGIIRLAFVVLTLLTAGAFGLVYFIAMIGVPPAGTLEEQAEAHGQPFNAQEVVDNAKKHYANFKKDSAEWWRKGPGGPEWKEEFRHNMRNVRRETRRAAREARRAFRSFHVPPQVDQTSHVFSMVMLPVFGLIMAALTVVWILAIISLLNTGAVFGWPFPIAVPIWVAVIILVALYGAVVGPFKMAFHGRGYMYGGRYYGWPGVLGGFVWMVCLILGFLFAYTYIPEVRDFVENLPSIVNNALRR